MAEESGITRRGAADAGKAALSDLVRCLRFYSRLPTPVLPWETDPHGVPDFRMLPLAGAVIGTVGATAMAEPVRSHELRSSRMVSPGFTLMSQLVTPGPTTQMGSLTLNEVGLVER